MRRIQHVISTSLLAGGALALSLGHVHAAPRWGETSSYQDEIAICDTIPQDRAACIREAGAARAEAKRGRLREGGSPDYAANALARCKLHPPAERAECEARVRGSGDTSIEGSVLGGGLLRETQTVIPAPAPAPAPAPRR